MAILYCQQDGYVINKLMNK